MSTVPEDSAPYYDISSVKENIGEVGDTETDQQLQNWGDEADREIDSKLMWLFPTFPLTEDIITAAGFQANVFQQIKGLANERLEAKFWLKTNSDKVPMEKSDENLDAFYKQLTEIPFTTE